MNRIDLNCDMGESYGIYALGQDEAVMDHVSSVNIACGFHAGDPAVMRRTVDRAMQRGVSIGAHPGFPDLQGFGRRHLACTPEEVYDMVVYQIGALSGFCRAAGARLTHVKPHGALYNMAAKDAALAEAVARAVRDVDSALWLYGLAGSRLIAAGLAAGLSTAAEAFADRTYREDGALMPRTAPDALIHDESAALNQVLQIIRHGSVLATSGREIPLRADTICIHGDAPQAAAFARRIRAWLRDHNIAVQPPYR